MTAGDFRESIPLPGIASGNLSDSMVNFARDNFSATTEEDATCTGTLAAPTAPAGKVCIYLGGVQSGMYNIAGLAHGSAPRDRSFAIAWTDDGLTADTVLYGSWAYTE